VSASLADYDNDGILDIFFANGALLRSERNFLQRNQGGGMFTDQAVAAGLEQALQSNQGVWADIDNDGDPDLFVTNYGQGNRLYVNQGDGTFDPIIRNHALAETAYSTGAAWGDYDNDGFFDLCVVNHGFQQSGSQPILLYRNLGNGQFEKVARDPAHFVQSSLHQLFGFEGSRARQ
jgi:enediyne biosynthesis protein E4